jgi:hypothetical protein
MKLLWSIRNETKKRQNPKQDTGEDLKKLQKKMLIKMVQICHTITGFL